MDTTAMILSIIGAINWGLVSLFQFDLVAWVFGGQTAFLSRLVYGLVGLAGGAATAGCCAHMVGFAVCSYRENKANGLASK